MYFGMNVYHIILIQCIQMKVACATHLHTDNIGAGMGHLQRHIVSIKAVTKLNRNQPYAGG